MKDEAYGIAIKLKSGKYHEGLAIMVYKFFDKKTGLKARQMKS